MGARATGLSGILVFLSGVATVALMAAARLPEQFFERAGIREIADLLEDMAGLEGIIIASMWALIMMSVFLAAFGAGLHRLVEDDGSPSRWALWALLGGVVFLQISALVTIGLAGGVVPAYMAATEAERLQVKGVGVAMLYMRNHGALLASALLAFWALLASGSLLRSRSIPAWSGYGLRVIGILGLLGALWPLLHGLSFLRSAQLVLLLLWSLGTGASLVRWRLSEKTGRRLATTA